MLAPCNYLHRANDCTAHMIAQDVLYHRRSVEYAQNDGYEKIFTEWQTSLVCRGIDRIAPVLLFARDTAV